MPADSPRPALVLVAPEGKKTVVMDIPMPLWLWAREQALREGTNLTQKTIGLYKRWQAEIEAANLKPKPKRAKAKKAGRQGKK